MITLDEHTLLLLHHLVASFYVDTDRPVTLGHNLGMVQVCAERPFGVFYGFMPFPAIIVQAAALLEGIITFHPFADGNKRVALLATYCFLYWNGIDLDIPVNADEFTVEIAEQKHDIATIARWVAVNTKKSPGSILRSILLAAILVFSNRWPQIVPLIPSVFWRLWIPQYPFGFFRYKIGEQRRQTS